MWQKQLIAKVFFSNVKGTVHSTPKPTHCSFTCKTTVARRKVARLFFFQITSIHAILLPEYRAVNCLASSCVSVIWKFRMSGYSVFNSNEKITMSHSLLLCVCKYVLSFYDNNFENNVEHNVNAWLWFYSETGNADSLRRKKQSTDGILAVSSLSMLNSRQFCSRNFNKLKFTGNTTNSWRTFRLVRSILQVRSGAIFDRVVVDVRHKAQEILQKKESLSIENTILCCSITWGLSCWADLLWFIKLKCGK